MSTGRATPAHRSLLAVLAVLAVLLLTAASAAAQDPLSRGGSTAVTTPLPDLLPDRPDGYAIDAEQALRIADRDPAVAQMTDERGPLTANVSAEAVEIWEVGYFSGGEKVLLVIVGGNSGEVEEAFTGSAVAWPMARGRDGQFGHILNSPWVWGTFALIFAGGLADPRRPFRIAHLDLLVLLSFGVSQALFNAAEIGLSVPLYYPPLLYLLARMLWIGTRPPPAAGEPTRGLKPGLPTKVLVGLCIVLAIGRIGMNVFDSGVIDVGYAGAVGADRITDAEPIYGEGAFPENNPTGDTYGPANYFAYVPFEQAFPWSGAWDALPAARAAAIGFDLAAVAGLLLLGLRLGGRRTGVLFAFAWLAYPYTAFVLQSNSNDSLLAALLIWSLVAFTSPVARGALIGTAAMTKFAPLVLVPLYMTGRRGLAGAWTSRALFRSAALAGLAFTVSVALWLAHPLVDPGLATFYERTIGSQAGRESPFSIWGQADLEWLHTLAKIAVVVLTLAVAVIPRERAFGQVAALGGALMIAVEVLAEHWFYLYIVWFLPFVLVALLAGGPAGVRDRRAPA